MPAGLPPPTAACPLLPWLVAVLAPTNRTRVKQLLRSGRVHVNGTPTTRHDHPLNPGDRVTLGPATVPSLSDLPIVFEDDAIIAVDKPAGLLTVATETERAETAFARLAGHLAARNAGRPFVVHRLDRETSGLLLFARTAEARDRLHAGWEAVAKTYVAVVQGRPPHDEGTVENFLAEGDDYRVRTCRADDAGAKRALTRYRVTGANRRHTRVEVELVTGRKHQIRVHMKGLGCPVVGDRMYGAKTDPAGRLALHAARLAFPHPLTGAPVEVRSPLPAALRKLTAS